MSGCALRNEFQSLTAEQATKGAVVASCAVMKSPAKWGVFQNHAVIDMGSRLPLENQTLSAAVLVGRKSRNMVPSFQIIVFQAFAFQFSLIFM